ncbi:MAG: 50S ribosomal protein L9 [Lentisphaeria bacterium]|nr:50S ribosomal protein L9 [Lentisphaeria bacterium]
MATELILVKNVKDLGKIGDIVRVADGFARNYLLPQGAAEAVTKNALRKVESLKIAAQKEYAENVNIAKTLATSIEAASVTFAMEANEEGKLFGSVTARMIADELKASAGIEIETSCVLLSEAIHSVCELSVDIALLPEVATTLKVSVTSKTVAVAE